MIIKKRTTAGMTSQEWLDEVQSKKERDAKVKIKLTIETFIDAFDNIARYIEFLFWRVRHWPCLGIRKREN